MIIAGIEEAGRGPVIGPMVMAIAAIDEKDEHKLQEIGVKDSKLILPDKRKEILKKIKEICSYELIVLSNQDVDDALNDPGINLNWLEAINSAMLINKIKPDKVILDCPSTNIQAYTDYVNNLVKSNTKIIAEHKADLNYLIVGAASIIAKVTRDDLIEELKKKYNIDFGSGYPSDEKTVRFLKENYDKYPIFRKTWASYKKVVRDKGQMKLT